MPERGGTTTQSGIYYQNKVAALFLGDLRDASPRPDSERVTEVRVEAPWAVDDIVVTYADGHRLYIPAKEKVARGDSAWIDTWRDIERQFFSPDFRLGDGGDRLLLYIRRSAAGALTPPRDLRACSWAHCIRGVVAVAQ